jgi:hypothetical protein
MDGVSRTNRILSSVLIWGGIALALAAFSLDVLPATYSTVLVVEGLFYASGPMIGFGVWLGRCPRWPAWRAMALGVAVQCVLVVARYLFELALGF